MFIHRYLSSFTMNDPIVYLHKKNTWILNVACNVLIDIKVSEGSKLFIIKTLYTRSCWGQISNNNRMSRTFCLGRINVLKSLMKYIINGSPNISRTVWHIWIWIRNVFTLYILKLSDEISCQQMDSHYWSKE